MKTVLRGIPAEVTEDQVREELEDKGIKVKRSSMDETEQVHAISDDSHVLRKIG